MFVAFHYTVLIIYQAIPVFKPITVYIYIYLSPDKQKSIKRKNLLMPLTLIIIFCITFTANLWLS